MIHQLTFFMHMKFYNAASDIAFYYYCWNHIIQYMMQFIASYPFLII